MPPKNAPTPPESTRKRVFSHTAEDARALPHLGSWVYVPFDCGAAAARWYAGKVTGYAYKQNDEPARFIVQWNSGEKDSAVEVTKHWEQLSSDPGHAIRPFESQKAAKEKEKRTDPAAIEKRNRRVKTWVQFAIDEGTFDEMVPPFRFPGMTDQQERMRALARQLQEEEANPYWTSAENEFLGSIEVVGLTKHGHVIMRSYFWAWLMNAKVRPAVMESKYLEMARQLEAAKLALEAAAELQVELYPTPPISATLSPSQKGELISTGNTYKKLVADEGDLWDEVYYNVFLDRTSEILALLGSVVGAGLQQNAVLTGQLGHPTGSRTERIAAARADQLGSLALGPLRAFFEAASLPCGGATSASKDRADRAIPVLLEMLQKISDPSMRGPLTREASDDLFARLSNQEAVAFSRDYCFTLANKQKFYGGSDADAGEGKISFPPAAGGDTISSVVMTTDNFGHEVNFPDIQLYRVEFTSTLLRSIVESTFSSEVLEAIRKRGLRKLEDVPMADTNLTGPASFLPTAEQDEQVRYYTFKLTQAMDYALPWEQANSDAEDRAARFLKHSKRLERKNNINNDVHFGDGRSEGLLFKINQHCLSREENSVKVLTDKTALAGGSSSASRALGGLSVWERNNIVPSPALDLDHSNIETLMKLNRDLHESAPGGSTLLMVCDGKPWEVNLKLQKKVSGTRIEMAQRGELIEETNGGGEATIDLTADDDDYEEECERPPATCPEDDTNFNPAGSLRPDGGGAPASVRGSISKVSMGDIKSLSAIYYVLPVWHTMQFALENVYWRLMKMKSGCLLRLTDGQRAK